MLAANRIYPQSGVAIRSRVVFGALAAFLLFASIDKAAAQDVAVLWDVSLSVNTSKASPYTDKFRQALLDLLVSGRGVDEHQWSVIRPDPYPPELQQILSGSRLIVSKDSRVLVVRFGRMKRARFPNLPYFDSTLITKQAGKDLSAELLNSFPRTALENMTNIGLAQAAAARYWYDRGSVGWYLVTISDFKSDAEQLTSAETTLIDQFTASRIAVRTRPAVLRFHETPAIAVQIEFHGRSAAPALPPAPSRMLQLTTPREGAELKPNLRPTFAWVWGGTDDEDAQAQHFSIVVTQRGASKPVLQRTVDRGPVVADKALPAGDYNWQVVASFAPSADGTRLAPVMSAPAHFRVQGSPFGWLIVVLAVIAVIGAAVALRRYQEAKRRPA